MEEPAAPARATIELDFIYSGARLPLNVDPAAPLEEAMAVVARKTGLRVARQILLARGVMGPLKRDHSPASYGFGSGTAIYVYGANQKAASEHMERQDAGDAAEVVQEGPRAVGIANPNNSCFVNSVIQLLYTSEPFRRVVEDMLPTQELAPGSSGRAMAEALAAAFSTLHAAKETLYPSQLLDACTKLFPDLFQATLGVYRQQDAQEFAQRLLTWLSNISEPLQLRVGSQADKDVLQRLGETGRIMGYRDFVHELFGFRLVRGGVQSRDLIFLDIQIDSSTTSLEVQLDRQMTEGFSDLMGAEQAATPTAAAEEAATAEEGVAADASNPAESVSADPSIPSIPVTSPNASAPAASQASSDQHWAFFNLPDFLLVHFLRYTWDETEGVGQKVRRHVTFPEELDLASFCSPEALRRPAHDWTARPTQPGQDAPILEDLEALAGPMAPIHRFPQELHQEQRREQHQGRYRGQHRGQHQGLLPRLLLRLVLQQLQTQFRSRQPATS